MCARFKRLCYLNVCVDKHVKMYSYLDENIYDGYQQNDVEIRQ